MLLIFLLTGVLLVPSHLVVDEVVVALNVPIHMMDKLEQLEKDDICEYAEFFPLKIALVVVVHGLVEHHMLVTGPTSQLDVIHSGNVGKDGGGTMKDDSWSQPTISWMHWMDF